VRESDKKCTQVHFSPTWNTSALPVIHPRFANSVKIVLELIFVPVLTAVEGRKRLRIFRKNFVIGTVCRKVLFAPFTRCVLSLGGSTDRELIRYAMSSAAVATL
jgi:hypothetical protein